MADVWPARPGGSGLAVTRCSGQGNDVHSHIPCGNATFVILPLILSNSRRCCFPFNLASGLGYPTCRKASIKSRLRNRSTCFFSFIRQKALVSMATVIPPDEAGGPTPDLHITHPFQRPHPIPDFAMFQSLVSANLLLELRDIRGDRHGDIAVRVSPIPSLSC